MNRASTVTVALFAFACSGAEPTSTGGAASDRKGSTVQVPQHAGPTSLCPLESPWFAAKGEPPVSGAVGVLMYGMQEPLNAPLRSDIGIWWLNGSRTSYAKDDLLWSPEGELAPILGELHLPAAFAVGDADALVWGKRGWGCAPTQLAGKDVFQPFDDLLAREIAAVEAGAKDFTNADGYVLQANSALVLTAQRLRREPRDNAPFSGAEIAERLPCLRSSLRLTSSNKFVPGVDAIKESKQFPTTCVSTVRVVERRGQWAKVIVPKDDRPLYDFDPGLAVAWDDKPAGWARIEEDGPLPGTRLIKWSVKHWWAP